MSRELDILYGQRAFADLSAQQAETPKELVHWQERVDEIDEQIKAQEEKEGI